MPTARAVLEHLDHLAAVDRDTLETVVDHLYAVVDLADVVAAVDLEPDSVFVWPEVLASLGEVEAARARTLIARIASDPEPEGDPRNESQ